MSRKTRYQPKPGSISIRTFTAFGGSAKVPLSSTGDASAPTQSRSGASPSDRKSTGPQENNPSSTSANGAGPSKLRYNSVPGVNSKPQTNPDSGSRLVQLDKTLFIPDQSKATPSQEICMPPSVSSAPSRPKYSIVVDGKIYITVPTKARMPEICRKYFENNCHFDSQCDRIHLFNEVTREEMEYISEKLTETYRDALTTSTNKSRVPSRKNIRSQTSERDENQPCKNTRPTQKGKLPSSVFDLPRIDDIEVSSQSTLTITEGSTTCSRPERDPRSGKTGQSGQEESTTSKSKRRKKPRPRAQSPSGSHTSETPVVEFALPSKPKSSRRQTKSQGALSDVLAQCTWDEDPEPDPKSWGYGKDAWDDTGQSSISTDDSTKDFWGKTSVTSMSSSEQGYSASEGASEKATFRLPPGICRDFQRGRCAYGVRCRYSHVPPPPPQTLPENAGSRPEDVHQSAPSTATITVFDHNKVTVGPGLEIQRITTGFESPWIVIDNLDTSLVTSDQLSKAAIIAELEPFGCVEDVRIGRSVKVLFPSPEEALRVTRELNGASLFGVNKLAVRLSLDVAPTRSTNGVFSDTTVLVMWNAPGKIAYGGYETMQAAKVGIAAAAAINITATVHSGLPAVGMVTVRFNNVPVDADAAYMRQFGKPDDVMWQQSRYSDINLALRAIRTRLVMYDEDPESLISFDVQPAKRGLLKAYAQFTTAEQARTAVARLHGWRPASIGKVLIKARHLQSVSYSLPPRAYNKIGPDINVLRDSMRSHQGAPIALSIIPRPGITLIRINADDLKDLAHFKSEFEAILRGEVVREDGKIVWDSFFATVDGNTFLRELEILHPGVTIDRELLRHTIKLYGPQTSRLAARRIILAKVAELRDARVWTIPLERRNMGLFMSPEMLKVQDELGRGNNGFHKVWLDVTRCLVRVRGDVLAYEQVHEALRSVQEKRSSQRRKSVHTCPVCLDEITLPVSLRCGHTYCRACLASFLVAASDGGSFPLMCLGGAGKCPELVQLPIIREILSAQEWDTLVRAAFFAYVNARPKEFHFCPTPDCQQIYRIGPKGTVLQCPACLQRICAFCHAESHEGRPCVEKDAGDKLLKQWLKDHDVKNCPGCRVPIERAEGCNHITCTQCKTHICWVCMETFVEGQGIYEHMRTMHGGIGLAVWEVLVP